FSGSRRGRIGGYPRYSAKGRSRRLLDEPSGGSRTKLANRLWKACWGCAELDVEVVAVRLDGADPKNGGDDADGTAETIILRVLRYPQQFDDDAIPVGFDDGHGALGNEFHQISWL